MEAVSQSKNRMGEIIAEVQQEYGRAYEKEGKAQLNMVVIDPTKIIKDTTPYNLTDRLNIGRDIDLYMDQVEARLQAIEAEDDERPITLFQAATLSASSLSFYEQISGGAFCNTDTNPRRKSTFSTIHPVDPYMTSAELFDRFHQKSFTHIGVPKHDPEFLEKEHYSTLYHETGHAYLHELDRQHGHYVGPNRLGLGPAGPEQYESNRHECFADAFRVIAMVKKFGPEGLDHLKLRKAARVLEQYKASEVDIAETVHYTIPVMEAMIQHVEARLQDDPEAFADFSPEDVASLALHITTEHGPSREEFRKAQFVQTKAGFKPNHAYDKDIPFEEQVEIHETFNQRVENARTHLAENLSGSVGDIPLSHQEQREEYEKGVVQMLGFYGEDNIEKIYALRSLQMQHVNSKAFLEQQGVSGASLQGLNLRISVLNRCIKRMTPQKMSLFKAVLQKINLKAQMWLPQFRK